jgi:hypothetical protein
MGIWAGSLLAVGLSTARAETETCAAWPGEPSPLPRIDDTDPFMARWAQLRAWELANVAFDLEASDPLGANETWEHLSCLDPSGELTRLARERSGSPRVANTPPVASAPEPPLLDWSPIDAKLGAAETLVRDARFRQALRKAEQIRPKLASIEDAPGASLRRTQLEVLSATAQIALGRQDAARESFERALAADPVLELDARSTSPKIRRVFNTVRGEPERPAP